jgi:VWFA-related protein
MGLRTALLIVALAALTPARLDPAAPIGEAKDRERTPVFATEVSLVSLPVYVVDKQGRALGGLEAGDFELYEDGKRVDVVSFQYVDTTAEDQQDLIRQAPAARRRFLFLFDLSFTDPGGLHRAQAAARDFLRSKLAESDLAAVATFDVNRGIRIVANFSEDRSLLVHAVETLGVTSFARINDPLNLTFEATDVPGGARGGPELEGAGTQLDQVLAVLAQRMRAADESHYRIQVQGFVESLQSLGQALRGVEGRKQILFFSAGFDSRAIVGMEGADARTASESLTTGRIWEVESNARYGDSRLRDLLMEMTRALSSADSVVHAVDVTGMGSDDSLIQTTIRRDPARSIRGRESLNYVSAETGGRFFRDTNDLGRVLSEVQDMTSRFYVLGYQPENLKGPGQFHKLKVKVARKGVSVAHRAGYFERVPVAQQTVLQRKFEAAQLVMTGAGQNDLRFSALCLPFPEKGERQTLGVILQVPREELAWKAGQPLSLEVYGYAVAEDGGVTDHLAQLARFDPARLDAEGGVRGLSFYGTLRVPPGKYTMKFMVQDNESGQAGAQLMDVTVPPHDPRVGFLLPPVVVEDASAWLPLDLDQSKEGRGPNPFHVAGKPFLPRATFQVNGGSREKLVLIAWEPGRPPDPASGIEIQSSLLDARGQPVPAGFLRIEKVNREPGGRRTYVLDYTPDRIASGDYTLRVGVGESGEARLESYALLRFRDGGRP